LRGSNAGCHHHLKWKIKHMRDFWYKKREGLHLRIVDSGFKITHTTCVRTGNDAQGDFRLAELSTLRSNDDVGHHSKLAATTQSISRHGGNELKHYH